MTTTLEAKTPNIRDTKAVKAVDELSDGSVVMFLDDDNHALTEADLRLSIDAIYAEAGGLPLTDEEKNVVELMWQDIDAIRGKEQR